MEKEYKDHEELSIGKSKIDKIIPAGSNLRDDFNLSDKIEIDSYGEGYAHELDIQEAVKRLKVELCHNKSLTKCDDLKNDYRCNVCRPINEIFGDKLTK